MLKFKEYLKDQDSENRAKEIQDFVGSDAFYIGKKPPKIHKISEESETFNLNFFGENISWHDLETFIFEAEYTPDEWDTEASKFDTSKFDPNASVREGGDARFTHKYLHGNIRTKAEEDAGRAKAKKDGKEYSGALEGERTNDGRLRKQAKLERIYGKQDRKLTNDELSENALRVLHDYHNKRDGESDEDLKIRQKKMISDAKTRRAAAGIGGSHLSGNTKNETANEVETNGRENHTYGISGSPMRYPHINGDGSVSMHVTCQHATEGCGGSDTGKGTGGSCLAQKAQGQQDATRVNRDHYSQAERHSKESHADHVLTMMDEIKKAHKKAAEEGKNLLLRGDNYTNDHDKKYNAFHKALGAEISKDGSISYQRYGYTKDPSDKNDPENGNHKVWSNSGPIVKKNPETGKHEIVGPLVARHHHMKNQTTESESNPHPMNQYVVVNIPRPNAGAKKAGMKNRKFKAHEEFMNGVKKFRTWHPPKNIEEGHRETGPNVPEEARDADEYHHPDGWGWTTRRSMGDDGKVSTRRYHYQDYTAITPSHDNRASDEERTAGKTKTREGKRVGAAIISSAVSSTPKEDLAHSTMFHDHKNLDSEGILHANHPDHYEEALKEATRNKGRVRDDEVPSQANLRHQGLKEALKTIKKTII